jgi:hypothetical protein
VRCGGSSPAVGVGQFGLSQGRLSCYQSIMKTLVTIAKVDEDGWMNIHAPAPPGVVPGTLDVVVVCSPAAPGGARRIRPRAGTLSGKIELSEDFHAPLEDFRPYME